MRSIITKLTLVFFCICQAGVGGDLLQAQENEDFYRKDFARTPLVKESEKRREREKGESVLPDSEEAPPELKVTSQHEAESSEAQFKTKDDLVATEPGQGIKIDWLGVIVSTKNDSLLNGALTNLASVTKEHKLKVGYIYIIGSPLNFLSFGKKFPELVERGGVVKFNNSIPDKYQIKNSPTWIVSSPDGEILLDGVIRISEYLTSNGELLRLESNPIPEEKS